MTTPAEAKATIKVLRDRMQLATEMINRCEDLIDGGLAVPVDGMQAAHVVHQLSLVAAGQLRLSTLNADSLAAAMVPFIRMPA